MIDSAHFTEGKTDKQTGQGPDLEGGAARIWTLLPLTLSPELFSYTMRVLGALGGERGIKVAPEGWACLNGALGRSRSSRGLGLVGQPQLWHEEC